MRRSVRTCATLIAGVMLLALPLLSVPELGAASAAATAGDITVQAGDLAVTVGQQGGITSVAFADGIVWPINGHSQLSDGSTQETCQSVGDAYSTADGGAGWRSECTAAGTVTYLTDTLTPAGSSFSWTLSVTSASGDYAQGITTALSSFSDGYAHEFWTTWGENSAAAAASFPTSAWSDPLQLEPFTDMTLNYGGDAQTGENGFAVPDFTIAEPATNHSLSLIQSPGDVLLGGNLTTTPAGDVSWTRLNNEITPSRPVTFHMDLVPGVSDWRSGLGWMVKKYPRYFDSTMPGAAELAGLGTYSADPGPFSPPLADRLKSVDYKTNWEVSTRGPYIGEWIPLVSSASQTWPSFMDHNVLVDNGTPTESIDSLRNIESNYTTEGFNVLAYFNTTEFGDGENIPALEPANLNCNEPDIWDDATAYAYCDFPDAILKNSSGVASTTGTGGDYGGGLLVDPGDPAYQSHLVSQAVKLLTSVPEYSGINIDRTDELLQFNTNASDGVSFYNGQPARSLVTSWKQLMSQLEPAVHKLGKQVWVSPTKAKRIDWFKGTDGIFSEFNNDDAYMNLDSFLGMGRPVIGWNYSLSDSVIQRYLYMGVDPMSDRPYNDHGLPISSAPNFTDDNLYKSYAPMFEALQGRQWLLTPGAVSVNGGNALANAFTTPDGVVVPVVLGGQSSQATLNLDDLAAAMPGLVTGQAQYLLPGSSTWQSVPAVTSGTSTQVTVPLTNGAAMVRFPRNSVLGGHSDQLRVPVAVSLSSTAAAVSAGNPQTVTAAVTNQTATPATLSATLSVPEGWTATIVSQPNGKVVPGRQAAFQWRLSTSPQADGTIGTLSVHVSYQAGTQSGSAYDKIRLAAGVPVPLQQITATASVAQGGYPASNAVDGNTQTFWHSQYSPYQPLPQSITLDLGKPYPLAGLTYLPRQDGAIEGQIYDYAVYISTDGIYYTEVTSGTWSADDMGPRAATFSATAQYVRLVALTGFGNTRNGGLASAAEIGLLQPSFS